MADKRRYVNILFDEGTLDKLDDLRFQHRFPSRTEAVRWLVGWALDQKPAPDPSYWEALRAGEEKNKSASSAKPAKKKSPK